MTKLLQINSGVVVAGFVVGFIFSVLYFNQGHAVFAANKFVVGDHVQTTSGLNVRQTPSTSGVVLGTQSGGANGIIIGGPTNANGYNWWNINYNTAPDGWSAENFLVETSLSSPPPPPPLPTDSDTISPTISITSPANSANVSGVITISVDASDNVGVTKVEFFANGKLKFTDTRFPYVWKTKAVTIGSHTLIAKAYDAAGNVGQSSAITVTILSSATARYRATLNRISRVDPNKSRADPNKTKINDIAPRSMENKTSITTTQAVASTGTIIWDVRLDGEPWTGTIKVTGVTPVDYPTNHSVRTGTYPNVSTGAYTYDYVSGGPDDATFQSVQPSRTQTIGANGTKTFTFNFKKKKTSVVTPPAVSTTGTLIWAATLNGAPWTGLFTVKIKDTTSPPQNYTIHTGAYPGSPTGTYTYSSLSYVSGGPTGAIFQNITPSFTQTLRANGTITFTLNFKAK